MSTMKTEYLISIDDTQNICKDEKSFANLLMINPDIKVVKKTIKYKEKTYSYENKKYLGKKSDYIYFHIAITANITDLSNQVTPEQDEQIRIYEELLSQIKSIVFKVAFRVQTIWDDVSFFYSKLAYPLIYDIENSMRKLITKFMVINIGTNWEKENTPEKLQNFSKKNKNEEMLYKLNFSQLSNFLFDEFVTQDLNEFIKEQTKENDDDNDCGESQHNAGNQSNTQNQSNLVTQSNAQNQTKKVFTIEDLQPFLKMNNWDRIFNGVMELEGEQLKKKWTELYNYRCKIAHNNQFIRADYNQVREIIDEIKPQIDKAIENLDKVDISESDSEIFSENYATVYNFNVKDFLDEFAIMSDLIDRIYLKYNPYTRSGMPRNIKDLKLMRINRKVEYLCDKGAISRNYYGKIIHIVSHRNRLVHQNESADKELLSEIIDTTKKVNLVLEKTLKEDKFNYDDHEFNNNRDDLNNYHRRRNRSFYNLNDSDDCL